MIPKTGIHWYRQDLRIHDNVALTKGLNEIERFIPIFIFDGFTAGTDTCGFIRFRFLIQSLKDLEKQYKAQNIDFMCFFGQPHEIIETLIKDWNVQVVSFSKDTELSVNTRDKLVRELCERNGTLIFESVSQTLFDPNDISKLDGDYGGAITLDEFKKRCDIVGYPDKPLHVPDFKNMSLVKTSDLYVASLHQVPDLDYFKVKQECTEQIICLFEGGETKALELYERRLELEKIAFEGGIVNPNSIKPIIFSEEISLSPYLRFGCLSVKKFYWAIAATFEKYYKGEKKLADATEQLYWREYFYQLSFKNDNFNQIEKNRFTFKIPWEWNRIWFEKWETGRTGIPWIDACMRQLRQEGWIHHVCRNSVAIFLTRGYMYHSWEKGLNTFLKYLIDADASICAGNWNYISTGDPEALVDPANCFCPIKNGKKIDPDGVFIRKYVPELKNFSNEYVFEPWKAPLDLQEDAGCMIGNDYPEPMLDHDQCFIENVAKLSQYFSTTTYALHNNNTTEDYKNFTLYKYLKDEFDDF